MYQIAAYQFAFDVVERIYVQTGWEPCWRALVSLNRRLPPLV